MVEGPGCTANGRRAKTYIGRCAVRVDGSSGEAVARSICGRRLVAVLTLGKELWLIFAPQGAISGAPCTEGAETAVRVHFGMNGSMQESVSNRSKGQAELALGLHFEGGDGLRFYGASISSVATAAAVAQVRSKHRDGARLDVCSAEFDPKAAASAIAAKPQIIVADAVLDQSIMPGAGNIIKNEALHRARVDPCRRVATLSAAEVQRLVSEVRSYSMAWLRGGAAPSKRIYNRTVCADCNGLVTMLKHGETGLRRTSFWCPRCCAGAGTLKDAWARANGLSAPSDGSAQQAPCQLRSPMPIGFEGPAASSIPTPQRIGSSTSSQGKRSAALAVIDEGGASCMAPAKRSCLPANPNGSGAELNALCPRRCPKHAPRYAALKRVRKTGSNTGRLFYTCSAPDCNFFAWADEHFPKCKCSCSRVAVMRISKTERSSGKWFFGCGIGFAGKPGASAAASERPCGFFAWASPEHMKPLGNLITPLL